MNHKKALIVLIMGLILAPSTALAAVTTNPPTSDSGSWTSGNNTYTSDNVYAYSNAKNSQNTYYNYGFNIGTRSISKIEVGIEQFSDGDDYIQFQVSWDGGNTWSSKFQTTPRPVDDDIVEWIDITDATSWAPDMLRNSNFKIRIEHAATARVNSLYLDYISVRVTHSTTTPPKPRIVIFANSIDYELASEFFGFLRNKGIEIIHATALDFDQYKTEKFIVILGGPDAYDGVGDIVQEILSEDEQNEIRQKENRKMYVKTNIWKNGQRITILAGSDRYQTQQAHQENKDKVAL